jgi:HEAT repeat protein
LSRLATSANWADRALAGERLAAHAGKPEVDLVLTALLDDGNSAVPQRTAHALLAQADEASVRVFLRADVTGVNEDAGSQCKAALQAPGLPERLREVLQDLTRDGEETVAHAAAWALEWLVTQ